MQPLSMMSATASTALSDFYTRIVMGPSRMQPAVRLTHQSVPNDALEVRLQKL